MNKPLLVVACAFGALQLQAQTTLHVSPDGTADGSSWSQPTSLHSALKQAAAGDQLWLQAGTYAVSQAADRAVAFEVPPGVKLLGGFSGSEKSANQRNPAKQPTILSGEIGTQARHDNAYTILSLEGDHSRTTVDGVTLQGAYANGAGGPAAASRAGGAVHISTGAPRGQSAPSFVNCIFVGNYARDGGAVYIDGRAGTAKPNFIACTFRQNEADLDGGAVYSDARRRGQVNPTFTDCVFAGNVANYGGAVFNQATKGTSIPRFANCTFDANKAYVRGAALYSIDHQGRSEVQLTDCTFVEEAARPTETSVARNR